VFRTLERVAGSNYGGTGLAAVAAELGGDGLTDVDFAKTDGLPRALMTAMEDLAAIGLVDFESVGRGISAVLRGLPS
jgi:hypothetical protein